MEGHTEIALTLQVQEVLAHVLTRDCVLYRGQNCALPALPAECLMYFVFPLKTRPPALSQGVNLELLKVACDDVIQLAAV